ncbi:MAG: hypothetical protein P8M32_03695 [Phycisphaerales bacterium]|nr:hypothetical protein [Phycisphaerales bacterium]
MDLCLTQLIRFDQDGHRLTAPSRKRGGVELSINEINGAGGATFEPSAMWLIQQRILACTEFSGLIGARIQLRLERTRERGGPFDLWVLVDVPFLGTEPANNIPAKLLVLPAVQNGTP